LIVDVRENETRVALLEEDDLAEIFIEKASHQRTVGNIYRGKVCSVLPGMQAAFVDIGLEKNAFLYVGEVVPKNDYTDEDDEAGDIREYNIADLLKVGQEVTVQVIKEPVGTKGARVTTHITLPGRQLVLLPNAEYIGVSRRITDDEERAKLKAIAEKLKPPGMGLIVRTASEGMNEEDFTKDLEYLLKLWESIRIKEKAGKVPRCLHKDLSLIERTVRDLFTPDIERLVINDRTQYEKVLEMVRILSPDLLNRVRFYSREYEIFDFYQIEKKIERALSRKVWLKCGGYLVIDKTEALTVIDVNTGKYVGSSDLEETVLKTNLDAAREIAKQIRLRDIGGIIIIDFIDMHKQENQQLILDTLKEALKKDRTKTTIVGMTGLGLIEMTRKKVGCELSILMSTTCPYCGGTGKLQ